MRSRSGGELYCSAPWTQWWLVTTRPSGDTNAALQPPSETIAFMGKPVRSANAEGSSRRPRWRSSGARAGICCGIHIPGSAEAGPSSIAVRAVESARVTSGRRIEGRCRRFLMAGRILRARFGRSAPATRRSLGGGLGAPAHELPEEARLALVEAVGMEGLLELQQLVVEVVADLVEEGTQEGAEGDDLLALRRAHPERDRGPHPLSCRVVVAVQLAPVMARAGGEHRDANRRQGELVEQGVGQALAGPWGGVAVILAARGPHRVDQRAERRRVGQLHPLHAVAAPGA